MRIELAVFLCYFLKGNLVMTKCRKYFVLSLPLNYFGGKVDKQKSYRAHRVKSNGREYETGTPRSTTFTFFRQPSTERIHQMIIFNLLHVTLSIVSTPMTSSKFAKNEMIIIPPKFFS